MVILALPWAACSNALDSVLMHIKYLMSYGESTASLSICSSPQSPSRWNFSSHWLNVFQLLLIASCSIVWHHQKSLNLPSWHAPFKILKDNFPSQSYFSQRSLSLYSWERCCSPITMFADLQWTLSSSTLSVLIWGANVGHNTPDVASLGGVEEQVHFPQPAGSITEPPPDVTPFTTTLWASPYRQLLTHQAMSKPWAPCFSGRICGRWCQRFY